MSFPELWFQWFQCKLVQHARPSTQFMQMANRNPEWKHKQAAKGVTSVERVAQRRIPTSLGFGKPQCSFYFLRAFLSLPRIFQLGRIDTCAPFVHELSCSLFIVQWSFKQTHSVKTVLNSYQPAILRYEISHLTVEVHILRLQFRALMPGSWY